MSFVNKAEQHLYGHLYGGGRSSKLCIVMYLLTRMLLPINPQLVCSHRLVLGIRPGLSRAHGMLETAVMMRRTVVIPNVASVLAPTEWCPTLVTTMLWTTTPQYLVHLYAHTWDLVDESAFEHTFIMESLTKTEYPGMLVSSPSQ